MTLKELMDQLSIYNPNMHVFVSNNKHVNRQFYAATKVLINKDKDGYHTIVIEFDGPNQ